MRRPLLLSRQDGGSPCGRAATCCDRVLPPAALAPGEGSVLRDWPFPAISPPRRFCFAIARLQSVAVPWVRAQGAHGKTAAHGPKAKPMGTFSGGGRAPAPPQMAKQSLRHWLSAEQSCRARPVRAPKEGHWPRHWLSAPHKPRAAAMACERSALRSPLSHPLACEREALRPILSHPLPGKRP